MSRNGVCLAEMEGLGRVYDCGSCGNIHVQVGPVSITLEPKAYMQLVAMLSTSAANFEIWLQQKSGVDLDNIESDGAPDGAPDGTSRRQGNVDFYER